MILHIIKPIEKPKGTEEGEGLDDTKATKDTKLPLYIEPTPHVI